MLQWQLAVKIRKKVVAAWRCRSRLSHGLYSTAPSTTIITVTHTRVAAARAPDTHRSSASCDRGSYDASARKSCGRSTAGSAHSQRTRLAGHTQGHVGSVASEFGCVAVARSGCGAPTVQNERVVVRDGKRRGGSRSYRRRRRWCPVRTRWVSSAECRFGLATVAGATTVRRRTVPTTMRPTFRNDTYLTELPLQQAWYDIRRSSTPLNR